MKKEIFNQVEEAITIQSLMVTENIRNHYNTLQNKVNDELKTARYVFDSSGTPALVKDEKMSIEATNQITKEKSTITIPTMKIEGKKIADNFEIVDEVKSMVGVTCTIFQVIDEGILRISTNVQKEDGSRAVGTYIPKDSPVYETVMKGETYFGRAYVVTDWYFAAYEPIKDASGNIIGVLYVGVPEKPFQEQLLASLAQIKIGATGYIWIIDSSEEKRGYYVLSQNRKRDGENIWDTQDAEGKYVIHTLVEEGEKQEPGKAATIPYWWINKPAGETSARLKFATVTYFKEWNWVIGPSAYYDEFLAGLYRLRTTTIILALVAIILGSIVAFWFALSIAGPFEKMVKVFGKVATGDLTETVDIKTNISELNSLTESCNRMITSVKSTINVMNKLIASLADSSKELGGIASDIKDKSVADKVTAKAEDMTKMSGRLDSLAKEYTL